MDKDGIPPSPTTGNNMKVEGITPIILEDYPLIKEESERIFNAKKRIKELELLIHHWEQHEKQKQVPKA